MTARHIANPVAILPNSAMSQIRSKPTFRPRKIHRWVLWPVRLWYSVRAAWRNFRISKRATLYLGPQYRRSRTLLELDITYACNLHCFNCNRSVRQAPEALHLPAQQLRKWVEEWIRRDKRWHRIRVLGGEPTLHPQFEELISLLMRYREWSPRTRIEVVTNGHGPEVEARLRELPADIWIENSRKTTIVQTAFAPFNLAPMDDPKFHHADYSNGCAIARDCGMGLTPLGYYPCALAGGIDRVAGEKLGLSSLPGDDDDLLPIAARFCQLCGRFRDGHHVPEQLRPALAEERISETWVALYSRWRQSRQKQNSDLQTVK